MPPHFRPSFALLLLPVCLAALSSACKQQAASPAPQTSSAPANASQPQTRPFQITGTISGFKDGTPVHLGSQNEKDLGEDGLMRQPFKSTVVKDGKFTITGEINAPTPMHMLVGPTILVPILLEPGVQYTAKGSFDEGDVQVHGGTLQGLVYGIYSSPEYNAAFKAYSKAMIDYDAISKEMNEAKTTKAGTIADQAEQKVFKMESDHWASLLEGNAPTIAKLAALQSNRDWDRYPVEKRQTLLETYAKELGAVPLVTMLRENLKNSAKSRENDRIVEAKGKEVDVGRNYKDITVNDANGRPVKLSTYVGKNKLVLLDFWASWCGPCRAEFPFLKKAYQTYHPKGFEIVAVALEADIGAWKKAMKEESMPWINLNEQRIDVGSGGTGDVYGVTGMPANVLISRDGKIIARNIYQFDLLRALEKELGR